MKKNICVLLTVLFYFTLLLSSFSACKENQQLATNGLHYQKIDGKNEYQVLGLGMESELDIVIASEYNNMPITAIADNAFKNQYTLKTITLPDTIQTIGTYAFYGCTSLSSIDLGNGVETINEYSFAECQNLKSISLSKKTTNINKYAFFNCNKLEKITFDNTIENFRNINFANAYANPLLYGGLYIDNQIQKANYKHLNYTYWVAPCDIDENEELEIDTEYQYGLASLSNMIELLSSENFIFSLLEPFEFSAEEKNQIVLEIDKSWAWNYSCENGKCLLCCSVIYRKSNVLDNIVNNIRDKAQAYIKENMPVKGLSGTYVELYKNFTVEK